MGEMIAKAPAVRSGSRTCFSHLRGKITSSEPSPPSNPGYWKQPKSQFTPSNSEPNLQQPEQEQQRDKRLKKTQKRTYIAQNPQ